MLQHLIYTQIYIALKKMAAFREEEFLSKCNFTMKTLLGLKTAAKYTWSILGGEKSSISRKKADDYFQVRSRFSILGGNASNL